MNTTRPAVIVTGSSGLLGHPICTALANRGYEVFAFDRVGPPEPPKEHPHVHDIECDVTEYSSMRGAMQRVKQMSGGKLASVVHLAAYYDFSGEDSELYEKITINGTDRLLNALEEFDVEQFVFTSTMLVHQPCRVGEHIHEDDPLGAKWPYPQSKIETESLIRSGHPNVRSVFLRIAGVYTDDGQQPTVVQQIKRIYDKDFQSHFFPGNTDAGQSAVHLDDAVDAVVKTVQRRESIPTATPVLIGEADPPSYAELQDTIAKLIHGQDWATFYVPKPLAKVGAAVSDAFSGGEAFIKPFMVSMADDHYAIDITRARELLAWQPKQRLIDVVPKMIQNLKRDPDHWHRVNGLDG